MIFKSVDVSAITGQTVIEGFTSWQTADGKGVIEHVAARSETNDLLVFWWSPLHDWQVVNVSRKTGHQIASPPTSWQSPDGPYNVEHVAAAGLNGDLIVFWWSPQHDWQAVNVTQKTGQKIASTLTSWTVPDGPLLAEHIAAVSPSGDLIAFWWTSQHDWQSVNISQKTGVKVAGSPTSWQTTAGPYVVEHLAALSANDDLYVFWWSPRHDWQAVNVSQKTGVRVSSALTSWQTPDGPYIVEHLAGHTADGDLVTFWWSARHDWRSFNVSQATDQKVAAAPSSWLGHEKGHLWEYLACQGPSQDLIVFWWSPASDWQVVNNTPITREGVVGPMTAWKTSVSATQYDHLAGRTDNHHLTVFWHSTEWDCPWAILVTDIKNPPAHTPQNPDTPISRMVNFFTGRGVHTNNAVRYFSQMSHGNADLSKSRLIFVDTAIRFSDLWPPTDPAPPGWKAKYTEYDMLEMARKLAIKNGEDLKVFVADVLTAMSPAYPTHGGIAHSSVLGGNRGFTYADHRYVSGNGTQSFGQEMGHGFGLDHSRADDPNLNILGCDPTTLDYRDPWDKMSTGCDYWADDPDYTRKGPGFNAWNMRGRGWLDEARVWRSGDDTFDEVIQLRPLHRTDLRGWLAAELPPKDGQGRGRFLVEFRLKEDWDSAIPQSAVLVHRFLGNQSYLLSSVLGPPPLAAVGDACAPWIDGKRHPEIRLLSIDEADHIATIAVSYSVDK